MLKRVTDLPENLFANPVWHALQTKHRRFAISSGEACRYPADVAPFAAVATPSKSALQSLHTLLVPGEYVWLIGENYPSVPELFCVGNLECLQMVLPEEVTPPGPIPEIVPLSDANGPEMVALTTPLAFPGFFRGRTYEMGSYYGVRSAGELIAMGGERITLDSYSEISGICTHPAHRGKGLAAGLIWQLVRNHRREGVVSWLHVSAENQRAIDLYLRLGFTVVRKVKLHRLCRAI
jgi:ribosomal protein S18 acetylase RimI-like enzyme